MEELLKLFKSQTLIVILLAGIGVTNIANLKLSTDQTVVRPDPQTGEDSDRQHKELRAEFLGVVQENRDDVDSIRERLERMTLRVNAIREEQIENTLLVKQLKNKAGL